MNTKFLILVFKKGNLAENITALLYGIIFGGKKFYKSHYVKAKLKGELRIEKKLYFGFLSNRLSYNPGTKGILDIGKSGILSINGTVRFATNCKIYVNGLLSIGDKTYINPNTMILANKNIQIGEKCAISWECQIMDDDLHSIVHNGVTSSSQSKIFIGDRVWIGSRVTILKGSNIGSGSIIASGSIVKGDFPSNSLIAGIPARIVKKNIDWK